jgi:hypothetical protein
MPKIGILTYHSASNFGANLQAYSTIEYFRNHGFDPILINWIPEDMKTKSGKTIPQVQANAHREFITEKLPMTRICHSDEEIIKILNEEQFAAIVIGSDALFFQKPFITRFHIKKSGILYDGRPPEQWRFPNPYWGSFIPLMDKPIPVLVMSVSSQNTAYTYIRGHKRRDMNRALKRFSFISVRDSWTQNMVRYLSRGKINPPITPDPVFGYNQNIKDQKSREQILKRFNITDKYLLISFRSYYAVTPEWLQKINSLAIKNNYQCIGLTMPDGIIYESPFDQNIEPPLSPEDWYSLIKYSSGYIGENMHPVIVALHNAVPFFSFDSYGIVKMKYFVNVKACKIHDILTQGGFLDHYINIKGRGYKIPDPQSVLQQIINFDYNKCKAFSSRQLDNYNAMMDKLVDHING